MFVHGTDFQKTTTNPLLRIKNISDMSKKQWEDLTKEVFDKVFKDSPIKRTGYSGIKRNLNFAFSDK